MTDTAALHAKSGLEAPEFASRRTLVLRRFLRSPSAVASLIVLLLLFVGCYALPSFLPYSYTDLDYTALLQPPNTRHWLGTNALGQDLLHARLAPEIGVGRVQARVRDGHVHDPLQAGLRRRAEQDAAVGDGDAMGVAAEIGENLRRSAEGLLGVDDPIEATHRGQMCGERDGIGQIGEIAEESETVRVEGGL